MYNRSSISKDFLFKTHGVSQSFMDKLQPKPPPAVTDDCIWRNRDKTTGDVPPRTGQILSDLDYDIKLQLFNICINNLLEINQHIYLYIFHVYYVQYNYMYI